MKTVVLNSGRERSVLRRHPWIFSGAVASDGGAAPGDEVEVAAADGTVLGRGWFSAASQIRVRMVAFGSRADFELERSVAAAVGRRTCFFGPESTTDAYRVINAESDGLPGVVADCYAGWVVCQLTSAGAARREREIAAALLRSVPGCRGVSVRDDVDSRRKEGLPVAPAWRQLAGDEPPALVEIREGAVRFAVDVREGHKTGFYLDQRAARAAVARAAAGREVLNCFAYTGGFGLAAAAAGATRVVQVDVSAPALRLARDNAARTFGEAAPCAIDYVEADVFAYLRQCRDANRSFDMIVLDPPKFADSRAAVARAARGYKDINLMAMKLLRPGGMLATFSCSGAMDETLFMQILAEAAADAQRDLQTIARTGHDIDHPVGVPFPEGRYLKGAILRAW